jgi:hypothetical protein
MTKSRAAAVAFALLLAIGGLNTYLSVKSRAESRKRQHETRALAVSNCQNNATLAKIERAFINRQESQSRALLESGVTFGIPPDKLPALIQASRDSQAIFLHELDTLAFHNCPITHPVAPLLVVPGSKPGKRSTPRRKSPKAVKGGHVPSAAVRSGARGVTGAAASTGPEPTASGALGRGSGGGPGTPSTMTSPSSQAPATTTSSSPPSTTTEQPTPSSPSSPPAIPVEVPRTISVPVPCLKADGTLTVC